jgi:hypothetical protein
MQNEQHHDSKEEGRSKNKFNNAEYQRWSEQISGTQSSRSQLVVESFLGTSENLAAGDEDFSLSLADTGK